MQALFWLLSRINHYQRRQIELVRPEGIGQAPCFAQRLHVNAKGAQGVHPFIGMDAGLRIGTAFAQAAAAIGQCQHRRRFGPQVIQQSLQPAAVGAGQRFIGFRRRGRRQIRDGLNQQPLAKSLELFPTCIQGTAAGRTDPVFPIPGALPGITEGPQAPAGKPASDFPDRPPWKSQRIRPGLHMNAWHSLISVCFLLFYTVFTEIATASPHSTRPYFTLIRSSFSSIGSAITHKNRQVALPWTRSMGKPEM